MNAYKVTVKLSPRGNKQEWVRFANSIEEAARSAEKAVDAETYGEGKVLRVEETTI